MPFPRRQPAAVRKIFVILLLAILPLDSLYASTEMYWAHHHSAGHRTHFGHVHPHQVVQHQAGDKRIRVHGENGSWDCPIYHYVAGMTVALTTIVFPPTLASTYPVPLSPVRAFHSVHPDVPQHRDKPQVA